jgi:hypothetical protein
MQATQSGKPSGPLAPLPCRFFPHRSARSAARRRSRRVRTAQSVAARASTGRSVNSSVRTSRRCNVGSVCTGIGFVLTRHRLNCNLDELEVALLTSTISAPTHSSSLWGHVDAQQLYPSPRTTTHPRSLTLDDPTFELDFSFRDTASFIDGFGQLNSGLQEAHVATLAGTGCDVEDLPSAARDHLCVWSHLRVTAPLNPLQA